MRETDGIDYNISVRANQLAQIRNGIDTLAVRLRLYRKFAKETKIRASNAGRNSLHPNAVSEK